MPVALLVVVFVAARTVSDGVRRTILSDSHKSYRERRALAITPLVRAAGAFFARA
jgi:hypothetical protein